MVTHPFCSLLMYPRGNFVVLMMCGRTIKLITIKIKRTEMAHLYEKLLREIVN